MRRSSRLILPVLFLVGCSDPPTPKPRGWFRIDLPTQEYVAQTTSAPFTAELPSYARLAARQQNEQVKWFDLRFAKQRATVHLTWTPVNGNLPQLIEDAHAFKAKHEALAAKIDRERVLREEVRVFGTLFDVEGDVASPMVFYLTDSTANFLYGALYFDTRPNADSLAPVTARLRDDVRHMAATLKWQGAADQ